MYIYEYAEWPLFKFDLEKLSILLEQCHFEQGKLLSKMELLGLTEKEEKVLSTREIVKCCGLKIESV